jgi:hypothetical protein
MGDFECGMRAQSKQNPMNKPLRPAGPRANHPIMPRRSAIARGILLLRAPSAGMQRPLPRPWLWLVLIFLVKFGQTAWMSHLSRCIAPDQVQGLALVTGDYKAYLFPVENYIQTGRYYIADETNTAVIGRMPYYGLVYYAARQALDVNGAYQAVVVFQVLVESLALWVLALLAGRLFGRRLAVYLALALGLVSLHLTHYANVLMTESLSFSLLVFFVYQYVLHRESRSPKRLLAAGVFLALAVSLKPYLGLLFLFAAVEQVLAHRRLHWQRALRSLARNALLLALPLAVWLSPWIVRNYIVLGRFVPFYDTYGGIQYDEADMAYRRFVSSWGGSFVFWDKRSAGCWFEPEPEIPCEFTFPGYVFTPTVTMEALEDVRRDFIRHHADRSNDSIRRVAAEKFTRLTKAYRKERPGMAYLGSSLLSIKNFVIHSGSYFLPIASSSPCYNKWQLLPKAVTSLLYFACLAGGCIGLLLFSRRRPDGWLLLFIPLSLVFIFPVYLRATDWRYFMAAYPFLLLGLVYCLLPVVDRLRRLAGRKAAKG